MNGQINIGSISVRRYFGAIAILVGLLFALIDDFPAGFFAALLHLTQWQLQTIVPMLLLYFIQSVLVRWKVVEILNPWIQLGLTALVATLIFVPIALGIDVAFSGGNELFTWFELFDEYVSTAPAIALCWLAINAPWVIGFRLVRDTQLLQASSQRDKDAYPAFYDLLPPDMQGELIYLSAELHYLAVVTTCGKSLVLYNLRDAIAELPDETGIQTHRSYWAAFLHVKKLNRNGRQGELIMSNGDSVPVSRSNFSAVEDAYLVYKDRK